MRCSRNHTRTTGYVPFQLQQDHLQFDKESKFWTEYVLNCIQSEWNVICFNFFPLSRKTNFLEEPETFKLRDKSETKIK